MMSASKSSPCITHIMHYDLDPSLPKTGILKDILFGARMNMTLVVYLDESGEGVLEAGSLSEDVFGVNVDVVSTLSALDILL